MGKRNLILLLVRRRFGPTILFSPTAPKNLGMVMLRNTGRRAAPSVGLCGITVIMKGAVHSAFWALFDFGSEFQNATDTK